MLNIKKYLKTVGITQKEFADKIGLSRPTLDMYIELFENGVNIPRERYSIIFKKLFGSGELSESDFYETLEKLTYLLERDQRLGTKNLSPEGADIVSNLTQSMNKDMEEDDWDRDIYKFINILLASYKRYPFFKYLAKYFIYLNGYQEIEDISEEEKPYLANFYKSFNEIAKKPTIYSEQDYKAFEKFATMVRGHKQRARNRKKEELESIIQQVIADYTEMGVEVGPQVIIEAIKKRIALQGRR